MLKFEVLRLCFDLNSFSVLEAIRLKVELILVPKPTFKFDHIYVFLTEVFRSKYSLKGHSQVLW